MADKKISELPNLADISDDALLVVEFAGKSYNLTGAQLKAYVAAAGGSGGSGGSGSGGGDMTRAVYDPNSAVAIAGGIVSYVNGIVGNINTALDEINGEVV